jgi:hypothetical protein
MLSLIGLRMRYACNIGRIGFVKGFLRKGGGLLC